jgi:metallophosphoesterase (TIGR03768 family)
MTDIHLTDKEGPAQSIEYSFIPALFSASISCYSPSMIYSTHVLNATIQTVNELDRQKSVDFVMALGDMANTSIYNEIRWFIDVLDGKTINPDSGKKDDPVPGPGNDYQDKYQAVGLNKRIPWYATIGNHDHFFNGAKPFIEKIIKNLTGKYILQLGNVFTEENALDLSTYSMGTLDGSTVNGDIIGAGVVAEMKRIPTIPSDVNRHAVTKWQMMKEFSTTTTNPKGHGFNQANLFNGCYSFEPKSDLPLKVIVLDDTMEDSDKPPVGIGYGCGSLGNGRFEWMVRQLQLGQREGKLMIIAAHVPIGVEDPNSMVGWLDQDEQRKIITELKKYPNFMLWVSGHRHLDTVTAFPSDDKDHHAENGFWEVETRSLREFPQQFRSFDIVRNSDNTISIFAANVDPDIKNNSFAAKSRSYSIAAYQTYRRKESPSSINVELVKKLTPQMADKIARYRK